MDEIDFFLLKKLVGNSRLTFRELADMTDLSVSAIHKRINKLVEAGIIEAKKIEQELQTEGYKNITPYIGISGEYYDSWIDQLLRSK